MKNFWRDIKSSLFNDDGTIKIFSLIVFILFLPWFILIFCVSVIFTFLLIPFVAIASLKYGSGITYLTRLKHNYVKTFEVILNGA